MNAKRVYRALDRAEENTTTAPMANHSAQAEERSLILRVEAAVLIDTIKAKGDFLAVEGGDIIYYAMPKPSLDKRQRTYTFRIRVGTVDSGIGFPKDVACLISEFHRHKPELIALLSTTVRYCPQCGGNLSHLIGNYHCLTCGNIAEQIARMVM